MEGLLGRLYNTNDSDETFAQQLDAKFEDLKRQLSKGEETFIHGVLGDEFLQPLLQPFVDSDLKKTPRSFLALNFVVKIELCRLENGGEVTEKHANYHEKVIGALIKHLESQKDLDSKHRLSTINALRIHLEFLLEPRVAAVYRFHKRLANAVLNNIIDSNDSSNEAQFVLFLILKWICNNRCLDQNITTDAQHLATLSRLQTCKNDEISRETAKLIIANLEKLSAKSNTHVNAMVQTITSNIATDVLVDKHVATRRVELLTVLLASAKVAGSGEATGQVYPRDVFKVIHVILKSLQDSTHHARLFKSTMKLFETLCQMLGPELLVVAVAKCAAIINQVTSNDAWVEQHCLEISHAIKNLVQLCPNVQSTLENIIATLLTSISDVLKLETIQDSVASKCANELHLLAQLVAHSNAPKIEALIIAICKSQSPLAKYIQFLEAFSTLVQAYTTKDCIGHFETLSTLVHILDRASKIHSSRIIDATLHALQRKINSKCTTQHHRCKEYIDALEAFNSTSQQSQAENEIKANEKSLVVQQIQERLKRMRQEVS